MITLQFSNKFIVPYAFNFFFVSHYLLHEFDVIRHLSQSINKRNIDLKFLKHIHKFSKLLIQLSFSEYLRKGRGGV